MQVFRSLFDRIILSPCRRYPAFPRLTPLGIGNAKTFNAENFPVCMYHNKLRQIIVTPDLCIEGKKSSIVWHVPMKPFIIVRRNKSWILIFCNMLFPEYFLNDYFCSWLDVTINGTPSLPRHSYIVHWTDSYCNIVLCTCTFTGEKLELRQ